MNRSMVSLRTRKNWMIDVFLFSSALIASLSGIYFLYFPSGGYQGGRNPAAGIVVLFERHTWDDLHTWAGVVMIAVAVIHLVIHWSWFVNMTGRIWKELTGRCGCMNARGRWNLGVNLVIAASFVLTALSGIYFLFLPGGRGAYDPLILFSRTTWDLIHTWAGVTLITAAVLHLMIHWGWAVKVTRNIFTAGVFAQNQRTSVPPQATPMN